MPTMFLRALAAVTFLVPTGVLADAITNGGFETGTLSGWTLTGSGSAKTSSIGVAPTAGTYQGYIETTGNFTALAPAVISSLGVSGATITGLGAGTPVNGTGISQSVTVSAGDVLSFDWNFLSDELNESATFNDFAFFTISGSAYLLASRNGSTFDSVSPPPGFDGQTDWATQTFTFTSAGTYTVGFGTFNVGDAGHNSALLLDAISIPDGAVVVPTPSASAAITVLLTLVLAVNWKRRRPLRE
jgi:hypothetical protein